jgi:CDP-paratose 2-epimerase
MRILIAGGCGFAGTNLAIWFQRKAYDVVCVDDFSRIGSKHNVDDLVNEGVKVVFGDVNKLDWNKFQGGFDVVMNCAAQSAAVTSQLKPMSDFKANVLTTMSLLEKCREWKAKFFHWSTNKVYPCEYLNTLNSLESMSRFHVSTLVDDVYISAYKGTRTIYGATKRAAEVMIEEYAQTYGVQTIVNRFSCIAGPYQWATTEQGWLAAMVYALMFDTKFVAYGWKGKQVRDILYSWDMCELIERQMNMVGLPYFTVSNVGGGLSNAVSLLEAWNAACDVIGKKRKTSHTP